MEHKGRRYEEKMYTHSEKGGVIISGTAEGIPLKAAIP
jgi:hypothetical protein